MRKFQIGFRTCLALGLIAATGVVRAEENASLPQSTGDEVQRVADQIDAFIANRWKEAGAQPADPTSDAEFLRRVHLHLDGSIPPASRVREFLADSSPDKRRRLVDHLLDGPGYVVNFTRYWRRVMLPETDSDLQTRFLIPGFEGWLRAQLTENTPYDEIAKQIINVQLERDNNRNARQNDINRITNATPLAFYQAKQVAPENLAAATSRIFLGIRIECAQCHDHPFDTWRREQFWSLAAFFAGIVREGQPNVFNEVREIPRTEISVPDSDLVVQAGYLDGSQPRMRYGEGARKTLADWVASRENPYFAQAAANRIWGHFFGRGLVDPVDDFSDTNPPSHPELLDFLAREFASHDFDLKFLIRAITASQTYQLSSRRTHESQDDPQLFARMSVQGLTPDQLYHSLAQATGARVSFRSINPFVIGNQSPQAQFRETFDDSGTTITERETTILQALVLMNGQLTTNATNLSNSRTLAAVVEAPFLDSEEKIEALYLAALSRKPRPEEIKHLKNYVERGGPAHDPDQALADVFWALLNSSEFLLNH